MTNVGATEGKEPDHISDDDVEKFTLDDIRGALKEIIKAKLSLNEKATVEGCIVAVDVVKQQIEMQAEQMNRIIGMIQTLETQFEQYRAQRVIELQSWLAKGGGTTPEDFNGS
jgi:hypothetical protein